LFETRVASFIQHNSNNPDYTLNVNKLADLSDAEIHRFKGYNAAAGRSFRGQARVHQTGAYQVADEVDWRTKGAISPVKDQASCGSCWAFGSAEALESANFIKTGNMPILSPQQIVDCAPNPNECGGTGGCQGSIPELAYAWIKDHGLALEQDYPYRGYNGQCSTSQTPAVQVSDYVNVPSNNYTAVVDALNIGPLAITVAAGPWMFYDSGVFTGCSKSGSATELDHVVQLVGYGDDNGTPYWTIRNSWGTSWGEKGYIRIARHDDEAWCGTDDKPKDGTGCKDSPPTVEVCGSCGILYDAVYPIVA